MISGITPVETIGPCKLSPNTCTYILALAEEYRFNTPFHISHEENNSKNFVKFWQAILKLMMKHILVPVTQQLHVLL